MARLPYPDPATLTADNRDFLAKLPQLNLSRMLAASPSMFKPLTRVFSSYLNDGVLDPELREIVILRTAHRLGSEYELVHHKRTARVIGMTKERFEAIEQGRESKLFSKTEREVMRFVDEVIDDGKASEKVFAALAAEFDLAALVEITLVIGVYTLVSQFCHTFDIELEDRPLSDGSLEVISRAVEKL
ncbi:MAG: carboxymuconolactone decarboxylase family protein [bacterium]